MFENIYTTKMSANKKQLQTRFSKICSKNSKISKVIAFIIFAAILISITFITVIISAKSNIKDYTMTENEFSDFISRPIGSVMADIYYADNSKIVFHYNEGFFIIHNLNKPKGDPKLSSEIDFVINLKKLNIAYTPQGSSVLDVKISKDGNYAYLSSEGPEDEIKDFDKYIISLDTGNVKKGTIPENTELFANAADTFATVQNPVGWYSNNCIKTSDKIYYLTTTAGAIRDIQLVCVSPNNELNVKHLFGNISTYQTQQIQLYTPSDIKDIANVELVANGVKYPLLDESAIPKIEKAFSSATKIKMGGTGCPCDAELIFTRKNGDKGKVAIATDSCAVFVSNVYYDYSDEDNSELLGYFGLDFETLYAITTNDD